LEVRLTTANPSERQGPLIVSGLEQAVHALEAGDTETAALALEAVSAACALAGTQGEQLTRDELTLAAELYARCQGSAARAGDGLLASLLESAKLRSASHAYKSRP
jgi:hypothetical protein